MTQDERIKELEAKLTERIRPNVEAAPWVIYEISNLEDQLTEALATNDLLKSTNVSSCRQLSEAQAEIERLRGALAWIAIEARDGTRRMVLQSVRDKAYQALAEGKDDG